AGQERGALPRRGGGVGLRHVRAVARLRGVGQGPHRLRRAGRAVHARPVGPRPGGPSAGHARRPVPPQAAADRGEPADGGAAADPPPRGLAARLWLLYAVLFVYGAAGVVHDAAESALVATAVDGSLLGDFNGLRTTAGEGMKLLAPLAGAGLYTAYGGPGVALLDAVTFLLAVVLYALLRVREERPVRPSAGAWRQTV